MGEITPKVSVVIACYNGAAVIEKAIQSVRDQTVSDVEVIVVDDGSRDNSVDVVGQHTSDGLVRLIEHSTNKGISGARNTGIQAARGAFICFLDQDDLWYPDRLSSGLAGFHGDDEKKIGLVFGNEETRVLETGVLVRGRLPAPDNFNDLDRIGVVCAILECNFVPTAAALFRRDCFDDLGLMDESIKSGIDDYDMFLRVARHFDVRHVNVVQAIRHVHEGNFTKLARMIPDALEIIDRLETEEPRVARIAPVVRSNYHYLLSREEFRNKEYLTSIKSLARAIWGRPSYPKYWLALALTITGPLGFAVSYALGGSARGQAQS